ncbi:hypothetical protein PO909_024919 [Leuciscus waleckii]
MVLLGKTGDGKSSSGNTILSGKIFTIPKVQRYTEQETQILDKIVECCGEDTFKHAVVLFTHGEDLDGHTIEAFVKKSPKLQELVNKCGDRCHVIDNKHWKKRFWGYKRNKVHVKNMLETIDNMVKENGCYTNELLSSIEEDIQDEMNGMDTILLTPEEKREAAKKKVHNKYLSRFAGTATGAVAVEAGVAAGAGIGAAAGTGIAAGVILGTAALAGAIGGGITGYKAAEEADSVRDAIKMSAKATYKNAKGVVKKAEQLPFNVYKKLQ